MTEKEISMKPNYILSALFLLATPAIAADLDAGKSKAASVCAACHGVNGVSVADHIPNLAGQRLGYLSAELEALKDGSRKSEIMNVIAAQLNAADIANVAAHYASQPGFSGTTKSAFLPNIAKTNVAFPANFKSGFTRYHTQNVPEVPQVKIYYANEVAVAAARAGKTLPNGSAIFIEVYSAKLDGDKKPVTGGDGFFVPDQLRSYTAMARGAGWGKDIPDMIRNEEWNYALFSADRKLRAGINQAECLVCHKPADKSSYVFTLKELAAVKQ
jgi:cytochrome c553